jgi:hypothetical protein
MTREQRPRTLAIKARRPGGSSRSALIFQWTTRLRVPCSWMSRPATPASSTGPPSSGWAIRCSVCHGPSAEAPWPLLGGHGCPKFQQAHGSVFKLDLAREQNRAIVRRYRQLARPDVPIRVLVTPADAERHAELLQDVEFWTHEPNVADLDGSPPKSRQRIDWRNQVKARRAMDRMNALDAEFLYREDGTTHMHIASCAVFEGPPPGYLRAAAHGRRRRQLGHQSP